MSALGKLNRADVQTAVHAALSSWGKHRGSEPDLLANLLIVQTRLNETDKDPMTSSPRQVIDRLLLDGIEALTERDEAGAKVLNGRFIDDHITRKVAADLHASVDQVNRWQRSAIANLTQILWEWEMELRQMRLRELEGVLPPPTYTELFGFDQAQTTVLKELLRPDASWQLAVVGIGGIGKTSLADYLARQAIQSLAFKKIFWLRVHPHNMSGSLQTPAQAFEMVLVALTENLWPETPHLLPDQRTRQLRQTFKSEPHLIIIDNLETEEHINYFAEQLSDLVEPTKVLFTTRARPSGQTAVYSYSLEELPLPDAAALLRHHAAAIGLPDLAQAEDSAIEAIYQVTGGNPLALKLVVSLTAVLPLPQILTDLEHSRSGPIEGMYRHIYWESWRSLSGEAQTLLQAMPLVAESGALPEQMQAMCSLDDDAFWTAVRELVSRCLLEVQGTLQERRYGIHRLTETFLRTEIIHWPEAK